jgi:hypothetical protein
MLVTERDLDVARELTETAGSAEYSCSPAASTHSLTPACPMCSASPTTSSSSGSALPDDPRRHPASTTNRAPRDYRRHLLIMRDRDRRALVAEPRGRGVQIKPVRRSADGAPAEADSRADNGSARVLPDRARHSASP